MATSDKKSFADQAEEIKNLAEEKLNELKAKAGALSQFIQQHADKTWEQIKSGELDKELELLRHEANEKLNELAEQARQLWKKISAKNK